MREFFARALTISTSCFSPTPEPAQRRRRIDGDAEALEQRAGVVVQFRPIDERPASRSVAEEDILRDGHFVDEGEFLVDDGEAGAPGIGDVPEMGRLGIDEQLAFVGAVRMEAAQELDERRFARAIFAAKRVNLAGPQVEGNVPEGDDAGKRLGDAARREHGD